MSFDDHKIAAVFADRDSAEAARRSLLESSGIPPEHCTLLEPGTALDLRRPPIASRETRHSLIAWHVRLGVAGLVIGLIVAALLLAWQPQLASIGTLLVYAVIGLFGATFGMLVAGAIALRADQSILFAAVRDRLRQGEWAVVTHVRNGDEYEAARRALLENAATAYASL